MDRVVDISDYGCKVAHEYWRRLGLIERRDRHADDANRMLNYAYAIIPYVDLDVV